VSSPRFTVSLTELQTTWSMEDVWDANIILDCLDEAEEKANRL
jgi:hypothetical protein